MRSQVGLGACRLPPAPGSYFGRIGQSGVGRRRSAVRIPCAEQRLRRCGGATAVHFRAVLRLPESAPPLTTFAASQNYANAIFASAAVTAKFARLARLAGLDHRDTLVVCALRTSRASVPAVATFCSQRLQRYADFVDAVQVVGAPRITRFAKFAKAAALAGDAIEWIWAIVESAARLPEPRFGGTKFADRVAIGVVEAAQGPGNLRYIGTRLAFAWNKLAFACFAESVFQQARDFVVTRFAKERLVLAFARRSAFSRWRAFRPR